MDRNKESRNYLFVITSLSLTIAIYTGIFKTSGTYLSADALIALYIAMQVPLALFWYVDRLFDYSATTKSIRLFGIMIGVVCIAYGNIKYIQHINNKGSAITADTFKMIAMFGFFLPCLGARLLTVFLPVVSKKDEERLSAN